MYTKRWYGVVAALLALTMLLSACAPTAVPAAAPAEAEATAPAEGEAAAPAAAPIKIGLVTDVGRVNDRSFNQSAWDGVKQAGAALGLTEDVDFKYIETQDAKDYADNMQQFIDNDYDVIVTVGFALGEATTAAAFLAMAAIASSVAVARPNAGDTSATGTINFVPSRVTTSSAAPFPFHCPHASIDSHLRPVDLQKIQGADRMVPQRLKIPGAIHLDLPVQKGPALARHSHEIAHVVQITADLIDGQILQIPHLPEGPDHPDRQQGQHQKCPEILHKHRHQRRQAHRGRRPV